MPHPVPLIVTTLALVLGMPLPAGAAGAKAQPSRLHPVNLKTPPAARAKAQRAQPKAAATTERRAEEPQDDYASCGCSGN